MSKYLSIDTVKAAANTLRDSSNALFVDFLILKREGLTPSNPLKITTQSTLPSVERLMGVLPNPADQSSTELVFFSPFSWKWMKRGYPRSGLYTNMDRSNTLAPIISHEVEKDGMALSLTPAYISATQEKLRRNRKTPLKVPAAALAAWVFRYDALPDDVDVDWLISAFRNELHLDNDEIIAIFDLSEFRAAVTFSDVALNKQELFEHLLSVAPPNAQTVTTVTAVESSEEDLPEDLIEFLRRDLMLPDALLRQLVTLLRAGKHLILSGPPGTGKSTLAARLAEVSEKYASDFSFPQSAGNVFTTATAEWTTFDTLGGYMPSSSGPGLVFHEGLFLQALRENKWLVIDELNRADVDKAFGQLFTVLSGHSVVMPYFHNGKNVSLIFDRQSATSSYDVPNAKYAVGRDWRIIATMNTFDRNLLFQLSAAFVRRFAVVHVGIPPLTELHAWLDERGLDADDLGVLKELARILQGVRPLGPAIWGDLAEYMSMRSKHSFGTSTIQESSEASFVDAITAYVLPQLDGLSQEELTVVENQILELINTQSERERFSSTLKDMF